MLVASTASGIEQVSRSRNGTGTLGIESLGRVRMLMEIEQATLDHKGQNVLPVEKGLIFHVLE